MEVINIYIKMETEAIPPDWAAYQKSLLHFMVSEKNYSNQDQN